MRSPIWIGPLSEDNQSAHKITYDILQPETDPHPQRARDNRQRTKIYPHRFQADKQPQHQHDVTDNPRNRILLPRVELRVREHARAQ